MAAIFDIKKTKLTNLNPEVNLVPPTKFQFNTTYRSKGGIEQFQGECQRPRLV